MTFQSGETRQTFTVNAARDYLGDTGASVKLIFESPLPDGLSAGTADATTVSVTDVAGLTALHVNFGASASEVVEGATTTVTVTPNAAPGSDVSIPISADGQDGATTPTTTTASRWT